jgi:hypothetical protein
MSVAIEKWSAATASARLRQRRMWRSVFLAFVFLIAATIIGDHLRARQLFLDDWDRYDGRSFRLINLIDCRSIVVADKNQIIVTLGGIKPFSDPLPPGLLAAASRGLIGTNIILHLQDTRTRDENYRLFADAILPDGQPLSARFAEEGICLADRKSSSAFLPAIERAEAAARRKGVGMWAEDAPDLMAPRATRH